jgi:multidrug efflux system outer membrane protein
VSRTRAWAAVLALALSACALGPDYERPELPVTPAFRDTAEQTASIADSPWFDVFTDPVLRQLVDEALANNRDLSIAIARVQQARDTAAIARSPLFPQIGYDGVASRGRQATLGLPAGGAPTANAFLAVANLSWELDIWGRIRRNAEAGRAEMLASDAFRRGVVLSLVSQVAQSYFELRELDLELQIVNDSVKSFRETYDLFNRRYRGGVASKLDPLRAQAALAQVAALVPQTEQAIVAKENEISVLLGRSAQPTPRGEALEATALPPEIPAGVPAQLLERRPDLIEAEQNLVAANALIGANFANYFPRLGLTALGGALSQEASDLLKSGAGVWSIAGQTAGPIFTAGQTTYQWHAAQANAEAATASYQGAVLNALAEVSDALTARQKLAAERAERESSVAALAESLSIARTRYSGGLATYLEVLDAQQQLYPEQLDLARTRRDELLAVVAIYRTLGGGWSQADPEPTVPTALEP